MEDKVRAHHCSIHQEEMMNEVDLAAARRSWRESRRVWSPAVDSREPNYNRKPDLHPQQTSAMQ
jgi:hypothetical protein